MQKNSYDVVSIALYCSSFKYTLNKFYQQYIFFVWSTVFISQI